MFPIHYGDHKRVASADRKENRGQALESSRREGLPSDVTQHPSTCRAVVCRAMALRNKPPKSSCVVVPHTLNIRKPNHEN